MIDVVAVYVGKLSTEERDAVKAALNPKTGQLKARAPSEPLARASWYGLQPNIYKVKAGAVMMLDAKPRQLYERLSEFNWPAALDKDMHALKRLGAW